MVEVSQRDGERRGGGPEALDARCEGLLCRGKSTSESRVTGSDSKNDSRTTLGHCFSPETPIFDTLQISKRGLGYRILWF